MDLLLVAGAVGLAGYAIGKRRERRQIENGYLTYHDNGYDKPQYGHIHYGNTGRHRGSRHQPHANQTGYYGGTKGSY
jgi:hypothetical protein